jgi:transcriptional regulator with GAF, ATPase, and Fis domain
VTRREGFEPIPAREDSRRRLAELASLYEVARALLGARDATQAASRAVLSAMGALGVRSGAMLMADDRGRYRRIYGAGLDDSEGAGETFVIGPEAREWILRQGAFPLMGSAAARALGPLRERLVEQFDAAFGAAVPDAQGLAGLLLFGPRLLPGDEEEGWPELLESIAALAGQALRGHLPAASRTAAAGAPSRRSGPPRRALEELRRRHAALREIRGESAALLESMEDLLAVAGTRFPVLLTGESGVGKELAARAIHDLSERNAAPFEVADCASIPRELIESELFGHVRGAFTGAHRDRRGAFELAHRGTLFLDEIGEMPLQLQTRLLRVLQEGRFRRVGDERVIEVDVRVVAATNRDLRAEVARKRFREDLYYRLNVFAVRVPPLRERAEDVVPLLHHFLERQGAELGVAEWDVGDEVLQALARHAWPGNVRELANLCAGLAVRARDDGRVTLEVLEHVWRRQHAGEEPPWRGNGPAVSGRIGDWVVEQARAARFNLIEAARLLQRRKRAGNSVPLAERSALAYYLTGEILEALVRSGGDAEAAARSLAGDEDLTHRIAPRVRKVQEVLHAARGDGATLRRRFAKLPAGYEAALERASRLPRR